MIKRRRCSSGNGSNGMNGSGGKWSFAAQSRQIVGFLSQRQPILRGRLLALDWRTAHQGECGSGSDRIKASWGAVRHAWKLGDEGNRWVISW